MANVWKIKKKKMEAIMLMNLKMFDIMYAFVAKENKQTNKQTKKKAKQKSNKQGASPHKICLMRTLALWGHFVHIDTVPKG